MHYYQLWEIPNSLCITAIFFLKLNKLRVEGISPLNLKFNHLFLLSAFFSALSVLKKHLFYHKDIQVSYETIRRKGSW